MECAPEHLAFETALDDQAYSAAWCYCCRLCHTREDAEDLLQDSLARACLSFAQLREPGCFKGWLLCIVRRCHLMRIRSQGRRLQPVLDYPEIPTGSAVEPFQLEVLESLNGLSDVERELLMLFYIEGLSLAEVAQVTGLRAKPLRQRLLRARRSLKQRVLSNREAVAGHLAPDTRRR